MAAQKVVSTFESAMNGVRVVKQGDLVCLIADGGGAAVSYMADYNAAQKWASSKTSSGARMTDRARFFEQLPILIARPGSFVPTKGSDKLLEKLAKLMKAAGYDLGEYSLPPEIKNMGKPVIDTNVAKKKTDDILALHRVADAAEAAEAEAAAKAREDASRR